MRFFIETYGCEMNKSDSLDMALALEEAGFSRAPGAGQADVVVLNTCSVRQHAVDRIAGRLGYYRSLKARRDLVLVLAGCMAQEQGEEAAARFPEIDVVAGTWHRLDLPLLLQRFFGTGERVRSTGMDRFSFSSYGGRRAEGHRAWVPIISGCSNFCAYCIVPHVRGPEVSRPSAEIRREAERLAEQGVREITLLGQNVNAYGRDSGDVRFAGLLELLHEVEGIQWIRFLTSHPADFDRDTLARLAGLPRVCRHLHLPLQSGSDRILRLMNRRHDMAHYRRVAGAVRELLPEASLTTDLLVGFPGETEEDFSLTLEAVRELRFDEAFTYQYSPRPFTAAGPVSGDERRAASHRLSRLIDLQRSVTAARTREEVGRTRTAVVERPSRRDPSAQLCRTEQNRMVVVPTGAPPGSFLQVLLTGVRGNTLLGEEACSTAACR
ncbi:MAG: tRNA (N6-isopentenyl adenosine(37)-C2)-methylthiotransferase MiaB [Spirochaetota bacterium]